MANKHGDDEPELTERVVLDEGTSKLTGIDQLALLEATRREHKERLVHALRGEASGVHRHDLEELLREALDELYDQR